MGKDFDPNETMPLGSHDGQSCIRAVALARRMVVDALVTAACCCNPNVLSGRLTRDRLLALARVEDKKMAEESLEAYETLKTSLVQRKLEVGKW